MPNYNRTILIGHMTRDPELKTLPSGASVCAFGIATNHKYKTAAGEAREEVFFGDVEAWGKTAEIIMQYFAKGKAIGVEGRLKTESWDDKDSGKKMSKTRIVCDRFFFVGGPKDDDEAPKASGKAAPRVKANAVGAAIDEDSIPF